MKSIRLKDMQSTSIKWLALFLCSLACAAYAQEAASRALGKPELVSVRKIWEEGKHNAFTDLIRFKDKWYCTFRESEAHVGGNGKIRVLVSSDGEEWRSAALLSEPGIDLRDPKLSIAPGNRLMLALGGSVYEGKKLMERQPRTSFSSDGVNWSTPKRVLSKGEWLWRVTWYKGRCYGTSYNSTPANGSGEWTLKLVESGDGVNFKTVTMLNVPGRPNETTLRFLEDGRCVALVRREGPAKEKRNAWIGVSKPPYTDWAWEDAGMQVGGPNFIVLPNGSMIAAGRDYLPKGAKTFVGRMDLESVKAELILPSGGDCSYPGLVWFNDLLWMSYYSSHEGQTCIYMAKIKF